MGFVDIRPYIQPSTGPSAGSSYIYYVVPNAIQTIKLKKRSRFIQPCLQEKATVFIRNTNVHTLQKEHGRGYLCVALTPSTSRQSSKRIPVLGIFYAAHTNGQVSYLPWLGQTKAIKVTLGNRDDDEVAVPSFFDGKRDWKTLQKHFSPTLHMADPKNVVFVNQCSGLGWRCAPDWKVQALNPTDACFESSTSGPNLVLPYFPSYAQSTILPDCPKKFMLSTVTSRLRAPQVLRSLGPNVFRKDDTTPAITKSNQGVNGSQRRKQDQILPVSRPNKFRLKDRSTDSCKVETVYVIPNSNIERELGPMMEDKSRTTTKQLFALPLVPCRGRFGLVSKATLNRLELLGSLSIKEHNATVKKEATAMMSLVEFDIRDLPGVKFVLVSDDDQSPHRPEDLLKPYLEDIPEGMEIVLSKSKIWKMSGKTPQEIPIAVSIWARNPFDNAQFTVEFADHYLRTYSRGYGSRTVTQTNSSQNLYHGRPSSNMATPSPSRGPGTQQDHQYYRSYYCTGLQPVSEKLINYLGSQSQTMMTILYPVLTKFLREKNSHDRSGACCRVAIVTQGAKTRRQMMTFGFTNTSHRDKSDDVSRQEQKNLIQMLHTWKTEEKDGWVNHRALQYLETFVAMLGSFAVPTTCCYLVRGAFLDEHSQQGIELLLYFLFDGLGFCVRFERDYVHSFLGSKASHLTAVPIAVAGDRVYYTSLGNLRVFAWGEGRNKKGRGKKRKGRTKKRHKKKQK